MQFKYYSPCKLCYCSSFICMSLDNFPRLRAILLSIFGPCFQLWFLYIGAILAYGAFTGLKVNLCNYPGPNTELEWWSIDFYLPKQLRGIFMCKKYCFSHLLFDSVLLWYSQSDILNGLIIAALSVITDNFNVHF